MIVPKEHILNYIPQRPPVVMIDAIVSCEERDASTSFVVLADNLFVENGVFTEAGLLENIAQTAAAKVGYECEKRGVPVPPGFIGGIKNLEITQFPIVGESIETSIKIENEVFGITLISGTVLLNGEKIASAEMKIVLQPEATA